MFDLHKKPFIKKMQDLSGSDVSVSLPPNWNGAVPVFQVPSLPEELVKQINEVYLLHILATNASRVLPPGKSLLSLLSSRNRRASDHSSAQQKKTLKDQVTDAVTRAFWDKAQDALSSSDAGSQLSRLRFLYEDLRTAVVPLVPSTHPIMYTLSNPLSPTSSPLRSASGHLHGLLSVLRERCAPVRDATVDALISRLQNSPSSDLPKVIIDTVKGIFDLADNMKDDLADFTIGTWTEVEARRWIRREALSRERKTILKVSSAHTVQEAYREWLDIEHGSSTSETDRLITRLMESLSAPEPVSPFPPSGNMLPPQFLFTAFDLVRIQNLLQALVIAASLRSLVRATNDAAGDWLSRVWVLLESEVKNGGAVPAETKLLNFEDEVIHAAGAHGDPTKEKGLREAVQRTLRTEDPVFILLQKRLLGAISVQLTGWSKSSLPDHMRTGRVRPSDQDRDHEARDQDIEISVKGFEDEVLRENVKRVVRSLKECLQWMEQLWGKPFNTTSVEHQ